MIFTSVPTITGLCLLEGRLKSTLGSITLELWTPYAMY